MASTESTILAAVLSAIQGVTFTVPPEEVAIRKWPYDKGRDKDHWYPGITIHRLRENEFAGTNQRDDIGYAVGVTMVLDNSGDPQEFDIFGEWRQLIRKLFIHQKLAGIASSCTCLVEPGSVYQNVPENYDVDSLVIRAISREART